MVCLFYLHVSQQSRLRPVHSVKCRGSNFVTALRVSILGIQYVIYPMSFSTEFQFGYAAIEKVKFVLILRSRVEFNATRSGQKHQSTMICQIYSAYKNSHISLSSLLRILHWNERRLSFSPRLINVCQAGWRFCIPGGNLDSFVTDRGTRPNASVTQPFLSR